MSFTQYKQLPIDDSWDAIVVGSGIGGLTTAALLSGYAGQKVLVLERHYIPGGYTHVFRRDGYEWDVGVHYVGEIHDRESPLRRIFDRITNGQLEWARMPDVYDRVVIGDRTYDLDSGVERYRARLKEYFPQESTAIDGYISAVQSVCSKIDLFSMEKAIPGPIAFLIGGFLRRPFLHWANRTTLDVLRGLTSNKELLALLAAQWGDYGLPPAKSSFGMHAIVANHYFEGGNYPVGGASRIAETIAPVIEKSGGRIVANAEVSNIVVHENKAVGVRMADGREIRARTIISDAGARRTFDDLLIEASSSVEKTREAIHSIPPSVAHICLYAGARETASKLGLSGTNIWVHPTPDLDANVQRSESDPSAPFSALYFSFPSAKDPDFERRHPGRSTIEAVTLAPYAWFEQWEGTEWKRRDDEYRAFKSDLSARLQTALEQYVPALAGKIDYTELSTPLTTQHFMSYRRGEIYGLSATPERFQVRSLRPRTPIRKLYLTGQDIVTPGVAGATYGGLITASYLLRRNLAADFSKPATKLKIATRPLQHHTTEPQSAAV
ncbi:MAG TPA: NAD(P)/FAD-dependent oxidoreductase [Chthoniobacterales bacterium]|nr:NAD(P)/FAD-dependent oxidoreductase [Chthoniobacterales bacterium]